MTDADPYAQFLDAPSAAPAPSSGKPDQADPYAQFLDTPAKKSESAPIPAEVGYPAAIMRGVARDIPFHQDIGAAIDTARTYFGGHPSGVPTEGSMGERFAAAKARQKAVDESLASQYPVSTAAGQIGGAFALPMAGPASRVASAFEPMVGAGVARALGSGVVGAGYGSLYGAGSGDTLAERLHNAEIGALVGGVGGAAIPAVASGISNGIGAAARKLGFGNPETVASERLTGALQKGAEQKDLGLSAQDIAAGQAAGQPVKPIDVGGATVRQLAKTAGHQAPEAKAIISDALNERAKQQGPRFSEFARDLMGHDLDSATVLDNLKSAASRANSPAYKAAMQAGEGGVWNGTLSRLVNHPWIKQAIPDALEQSNAEAIMNGQPAMKNPFVSDAQGNLILPTGEDGAIVRPTLEFWDALKKNIDRRVSAAAPTPTDRGDPNLVRMGTSLTNALTKELDANIPEYAAARAGAGRYLGMEDAYRLGQKLLGMKGEAQLSAANKAIANFTPEEKELAAHGLMADARQKVVNPSETRNIVKLFDAPATREKFQNLLGEDRANQIEAYLRREDMMNRALSGLRGSDTAPNLMALAKSFAEHGGGTLTGALAGGYGGYKEGGDLKSIASGAVMGGLAGTLAGRTAVLGSKSSIELAKKLVSDDPAEMNAALQAVAGNKPAMEALRRAHTSFSALTGASGVEAKNALSERDQRASGGRINLNARVEKARKTLAELTKPLMQLPDEHIAHALRLTKH